MGPPLFAYFTEFLTADALVPLSQASHWLIDTLSSDRFLWARLLHIDRCMRLGQWRYPELYCRRCWHSKRAMQHPVDSNDEHADIENHLMPAILPTTRAATTMATVADNKQNLIGVQPQFCCDCHLQSNKQDPTNLDANKKTHIVAQQHQQQSSSTTMTETIASASAPTFPLAATATTTAATTNTVITNNDELDFQWHIDEHPYEIYDPRQAVILRFSSDCYECKKQKGTAYWGLRRRLCDDCLGVCTISHKELSRIFIIHDDRCRFDYTDPSFYVSSNPEFTLTDLSNIPGEFVKLFDDWLYSRVHIDRICSPQARACAPSLQQSLFVTYGLLPTTRVDLDALAHCSSLSKDVCISVLYIGHLLLKALSSEMSRALSDANAMMMSLSPILATMCTGETSSTSSENWCIQRKGDVTDGNNANVSSLRFALLGAAVQDMASIPRIPRVLQTRMKFSCLNCTSFGAGSSTSTNNTGTTVGLNIIDPACDTTCISRESISITYTWPKLRRHFLSEHAGAPICFFALS